MISDFVLLSLDISCRIHYDLICVWCIWLLYSGVLVILFFGTEIKVSTRIAINYMSRYIMWYN